MAFATSLLLSLRTLCGHSLSCLCHGVPVVLAQDSYSELPDGCFKDFIPEAQFLGLNPSLVMLQYLATSYRYHRYNRQ